MTDSRETGGSVPARYIAAIIVGNALEFYDFLTYAYFAVYIGRAFFPSGDPTSSLLASLGTFGVGFVTRPIGSLVIGRMGDRAGRKPAMIVSFSLMGIAIAGLALTPPRAMIGILAPALVIFFRMLQGFALGGEVGPTTAFLLEAAPLERRGFYSAFQPSTQNLSVLVSGLVGFLLASLLDERQLQDFGWRIAFLLGAAIVPFGLLLRRSLPETFHPQGKGKRPSIALRPYVPIAALGLVLLASSTIGSYIRTYMTTYAIATLHMPAHVAFLATIVVGLCGVPASLLSGLLSDRIGRRPTMLVPGVLLALTIFPAFHVIVHHRTPATLLAATGVLSILAEISATPTIIWIAESLPASIRSGGLAIIYAVSIAAFGGTTQYGVTWLLKVTGTPLAPAWYWIVAAILGLAAVLAAHESAPHKVSESRAPAQPLPAEISDQAF